MCLLITLFNVLINQKVGHLGKRKTNISARERTRKLHTSKYINSCAKRGKFNYSNEIKIDYNQQCHPLHLGNKQYKQFPKKKKEKKECEREGEGEGKGEERERKREREEERMRKRGRESDKNKEKEMKEEEKMEKAILKVHRSLQMHSLTRS